MSRKLTSIEINGTYYRSQKVRHANFKTPDFVSLARACGVAVAIAGDSDYPQIADISADFVYASIMGTSEPLGYSEAALDLWADRARTWAKGGMPEGLETMTKQPDGKSGRDVFLYVISGFKARNPQAAMALIERIGLRSRS